MSPSAPRRFLDACLFFAMAAPAAIAAPAGAQDATKIFGHDIHVTQAPGDDKLMIDGREALSDGEIHLWEIGLAGGMPFILGSTGSGGTMCGSVPFVVSFAGPTPAVDVSPLECSDLEHVLEQDQIRFSSYGDAINPSRSWLWTPTGGFQETDAQAADSGSGWDAFRRREITAPSDLLQYADLVDALRRITGESFDSYRNLMYGPPDGRYEGTTFIGSNCVAHNCDQGGTLVIADLADRALFVAWIWRGEKADVRPAEAHWPDEHRETLKGWLAQW